MPSKYILKGQRRKKERRQERMRKRMGNREEEIS